MRSVLADLRRDLDKRSLPEILLRDLSERLPTERERASTEILPQDLFYRSSTATFHTDLLQRSRQEVSHRDHLKRSPMASLNRDLI